MTGKASLAIHLTPSQRDYLVGLSIDRAAPLGQIVGEWIDAHAAVDAALARTAPPATSEDTTMTDHPVLHVGAKVRASHWRTSPEDHVTVDYIGKKRFLATDRHGNEGAHPISIDWEPWEPPIHDVGWHNLYADGDIGGMEHDSPEDADAAAAGVTGSGGARRTAVAIRSSDGTWRIEQKP